MWPKCNVREKFNNAYFLNIFTTLIRVNIPPACSRLRCKDVLTFSNSVNTFEWHLKQIVLGKLLFLPLTLKSVIVFPYLTFMLRLNSNWRHNFSPLPFISNLFVDQVYWPATIFLSKNNSKLYFVIWTQVSKVTGSQLMKLLFNKIRLGVSWVRIAIKYGQ